MIDTIQRSVDDELAAFSGHERGVALSLLAWLGLRYYSKIYTNRALDIDLLQRIVGRYINEIRSRDAVQSLETKPVRAANATRKGRPDSMAHFPFADQEGTVPEVLKGGYAAKPSLLEMGIPGRKRFVEKVFEEMRFDLGGIRLSDLPEALDRIGIRISPVLRRVLERTRSSQIDGPAGDEDSDQDNEFFRFHYMEKCITLAQWKAIVTRFLRMLREGKDPSKLADILPRPVDEERDRYEDYYGLHGDDAYDSGRPQNYAHGDDMDEAFSDEANQDGLDSDEVGGRAARPVHRTKSSQSGRHRSTSAGRRRVRNDLDLPGKARDYHHRLRHVPSKIADFIRHDRDRHHQRVQRTSTAAKQVLAKKRVDDYMASIPWGLYDPLQSADRRPRRVPRDMDLSSGRSALEIAEAFLQGPVGRGLVDADGYRVAYQEEDLSPWQAQAAASQLLGLQSRSGSEKQKPKERSLTSSGEKKAAGFKTAQEHALEREREEDAKAIYSSQWKSSQGGWVADFGPAHTHMGYAGPERYRTSLEDLKQQRVSTRSKSPSSSRVRGGRGTGEVGGVDRTTHLSSAGIEEVSPVDETIVRSSAPDEMFFHMARDLLSTRGQTDVVDEDLPSPSKSRSSNGRPTGYPSDHTASSMSVETAVAGAGAGALDDYLLDSLRADEELLSSLQRSVSLKEAVRSL